MLDGCSETTEAPTTLPPLMAALWNLLRSHRSAFQQERSFGRTHSSRSRLVRVSPAPESQCAWQTRITGRTKELSSAERHVPDGKPGGVYRATPVGFRAGVSVQSADA